jgi:hypothetical protein
MEVFGYVLRRISIFPFGCTRKSLWDRCVIGRQSPALYSSSSEALSTSRQLLPFRIQAKRCRRLLLSLNRIRDWREKHEQRKIVECWPAIEPPCLKSVHHRIEL